MPRPVRLLAGAGVLIACVQLIAACGSSSHANTTVQTRVGPESIFEAGFQLSTAPAAGLDTLRKLGVSRVKVFLPWYSVAPDPKSRTPPRHFDASNPGAYPAAGWSRWDAIVRDAKQRGIGVDLTLSQPPVWAAGPDAPDPVTFPWWKPSATDFRAFVEAVGKRYSGTYTPHGASSPLPRVSFWSIWNEPNYGQDLAPQAINQVEVAPAQYRGLLNAAWSGLQASGHGHDTVLIGELAPRGQTTGNHPGLYDGMVPLRFIRALYCVDESFQPLRSTAASQRGCPTTAAGSAGFRTANPALFQATGFAIHPYALGGVPPNVVTPNEPDFADLPTLPNLETTLDRVQKAYGSATRFPIWSTEFGYQTNPPEKILHTTSPAVAAVYLNWAEYMSWLNPRIASYDQYLLTDPPSGNFASGLEFADGTPKATFAAYRMPLYLPFRTFDKGKPTEVWGCVRPARFARIDTHLPQRARIQFRAASGGPYHTVQTVTVTDPYGYFDTHQAFDSSGTVRIAWRYPHGPEIFSREVSIQVR